MTRGCHSDVGGAGQETTAANIGNVDAAQADDLLARWRALPEGKGAAIIGTIEEGPRRGDWEVVGVSDAKVKLRCPISKREFEWARFCYVTETREDTWPLE